MQRCFCSGWIQCPGKLNGWWRVTLKMSQCQQNHLSFFSSHLKLNSQRIIDFFRPMTWKTPFYLGPWVVTTQHCFFVLKHQVFEVYFPSYSITSDKLDTRIFFSNIPYQFSRKQNKRVVLINWVITPQIKSPRMLIQENLILLIMFPQRDEKLPTQMADNPWFTSSWSNHYTS